MLMKAAHAKDEDATCGASVGWRLKAHAEIRKASEGPCDGG